MMRQILPLIFLAGLLFGCSPKNEQGSGSKTKKVFRYNQAEGLSSLDPAFARNQANIRVQSQLYNGLFEFTSDLSEHPALADTWEVSEDGLTYTINIKKGIYFHDDPCFPDGKGREVKAYDFVFSFKRILDPYVASTGQWVFNDKLLKNEEGNISDTAFVAHGDYTLKVYLQDKFPPFLQILAMPYTFVVPHEAIEKYGKDIARHPVGTGPFKFKEWDEGNSLTLVKNGRYWRKDPQNNALPYLDAVQVTFMADKNQEYLSFTKGNLEFISGIDPSIIDQVLKKDGSVKDDVSQKFVVQKVPYMNTEYLGFVVDPEKYDDKNHPFLNKKIRQALSYAVNREEIVSFLRNNLGIPAHSGFVPAAMPSFDEGTVTGYRYDPDKAKQLFKEAGYGEGGKAFPEVTLNTTPNHKEISEQLQKQWAQVLGIKLNLEVNNFAAHQEMVDNGKVKFFRGSWLGDYPDEENFLSCFYSKNFSPAGPNKTRYSNPDFDERYEVIHHESGFKRHEHYHGLDQTVMNDAPVIVLFYDEVLRLHQKDVLGLPPNRMNNLILERVDLKENNM